LTSVIWPNHNTTNRDALAFSTEDILEGAAAFREKRGPAWKMRWHENGRPMKIVVCAKFVPDATADRRFRPEDSTVDRAGAGGLLSELDENAVEVMSRTARADPGGRRWANQAPLLQLAHD
jgi:hypothetical protein